MKGSSQDTVLKLNKSLYGLVQSPLYWFNHLTEALNKVGFKQSDHDPCMLYGQNMAVLVYVDDCLFFGKSLEEIDKVIEILEKNGLALTKEDDVYAFLGVQVNYDSNKNEYNLTQKGLIKKVLRTCGMEQCNTKATPANRMPLGTNADGKPFKEKWKYASVIGMLMYLVSNTRPDIQFAVHQCARFTHSPKDSHAEAVKRICRYLAGTAEKGIVFSPTKELTLDCYVDADFVWTLDF